jgi:hypothetical protein
MASQTTFQPSRQWLLFQTPDAAQLQTALRAALQTAGYVLYDPFPGGTGTPVGLQDRVRGFMAPPDEGWTRLLFAPRESLPDALQREVVTALKAPLLAATLLSPEAFQITVYALDSPPDSRLEALVPFLTPGRTEADLQRASTGQGQSPEAIPAQTGDLPAELERFAAEQGVETRHVDRLMQRMTGKVFGRLNRQTAGEADALQAQARAALAGAAQARQEPDWVNAAGLRLLAVMACLAVPRSWNQPDWKTLTAAYQIARQLARDPKALLLPGDDAALAALPDALEYAPVYAGRKNTA